MFLKKHSQPEWTPADRQRERLLLDYFAAETNLEEKAKVAIVRKGVIDLYPDGPDKDRAIKDFEAAQHSLLCAIGTVDGLRNDMRSYIAGFPSAAPVFRHTVRCQYNGEALIRGFGDLVHIRSEELEYGAAVLTGERMLRHRRFRRLIMFGQRTVLVNSFCIFIKTITSLAGYYIN